MLKQRNEHVQFAAQLTDLSLCVGSFFLAYRLRSSYCFSSSPQIGSVGSLTWILTASVALQLVVFPKNGFYRSLRQKSITDVISMIVRAFIVELFVLGSFVFFFQAKTTSRYFFGLFLAINYSLLLLEKLLVRAGLGALRQRGYNFRQVVIVGTGRNAAAVIQLLREKKHWGYRPCGILVEDASRRLVEFEGVPVVGILSQLEELLKD